MFHVFRSGTIGIMYALIDCNNFFVSCERVFRPDLAKSPVAVLSNNDGCVVARSNEVKAMGIPMGAPYFKVKQIFENANAHIFSSNYPLYADFSNRVMTLLADIGCVLEIYSIDEAFLYWHSEDTSVYMPHLLSLREKVLKYLGIPISVGVAPTKTLAKIANKLAKSSLTGFYHLEMKAVDAVLEHMPVEDIWGLGRRLAVRCHKAGILTALQYKKADPVWVKKQIHLPGLRLQKELFGYSAIRIEPFQQPQKQIMSSRSFGQKISDFDMLKAALIRRIERACEKARDQALVAQCAWLFVSTSRFSEQYQKRIVLVGFPEPTHSNLTIIREATQALKHIYQPALQYAKLGIVLTDLLPESARTSQCLDSKLAHQMAQEHLAMKALDAINKRWGGHTLKIAGETVGQTQWQMQSNRRSPRYTTCWHEIPKVKIA